MHYRERDNVLVLNRREESAYRHPDSERKREIRRAVAERIIDENIVRVVDRDDNTLDHSI